MTDYLARLKEAHKSQNTPTPPTDKTDKRGVCQFVSSKIQHRPRIVCHPPFGSDGVPTCYAVAWEALLSQCPPGVRPIIWEAAIYDAADLFAWWGNELVGLGWTAGDIFDLPRAGSLGGLAWFIRGDPVLALGPARAFTQSGRVFERGRP